MSWALEAIEKEAMARASHDLLSRESFMLGLRPAQVAALMYTFEEKAQCRAAQLSPEEIRSKMLAVMK